MNYPPLIWQHFENPQHVGELTQAPGVSYGQAGGVSVGTWVQVSLQVNAQQCIRAIRFKAHGSGVTIAIADYLAGLLHDMPITKAKQITPQYIHQQLALPRAKLHLITFVLEALQNAISNIES